MKTALQHFNELPEPLGQICIEEAEMQGADLNREFEKASKSLLYIIDWRESELGWDFYSKIFFELLYHESQPIELSYEEAAKELYSHLSKIDNGKSFIEEFNRLFKITRR